MPVQFSSRVSVPPGILMRKLDDESVVLHLDRERYFGLDEVGTRMFEALRDEGSVQDAHAALLHTYDVEPDVLRHDLCELAGRLTEQGLLRIDPADGEPAEDPSAGAEPV